MPSKPSLSSKKQKNKMSQTEYFVKSAMRIVLYAFSTKLTSEMITKVCSREQQQQTASQTMRPYLILSASKATATLTLRFLKESSALLLLDQEYNE